MSPVRRATVTVPAESLVPFGDPGFYAGGGGFELPAGTYALEFITKMHQPLKKDGTPAFNAFLSMHLNAYPILNGVVGEEPVTHELSMGRDAHLSFQPSANGKGLVSVPGGPKPQLGATTDWDIFRKSLSDSGLPPGLFQNDVSVLDGIWVRIRNVPEPESRAEFRAQQPRTGEAALQPKADAKPKMVATVTEILEEGKPWEGTGGFTVAPKAAAKAPVKATTRPVAAPVAASTDASDDDTVQAAAENGALAVIEANPSGCSKIKFRMGVQNAVKAAEGDDMAEAVKEAYFGSDDAMNGLLADLGFKVERLNIVPA